MTNKLITSTLAAAMLLSVAGAAAARGGANGGGGGAPGGDGGGEHTLTPLGLRAAQVHIIRVRPRPPVVVYSRRTIKSCSGDAGASSSCDNKLNR